MFFWRDTPPYFTSYLFLRYFVVFHFLEMVFWRPFLRRHPSRGEVATLFRLFEGHLLTILDANIGVSF
jgi:hypothetical protein